LVLMKNQFEQTHLEIIRRHFLPSLMNLLLQHLPLF
jgi:hypothetical protein